MKAEFFEIFSSIQGEGIYLGVRQIFVRFAGCNISCSYCDTESSRKKMFKLSVEELVRKILDTDKSFGPHHSISLTGGEPLLRAEYLEKLLPRLKKKFRIYLETNGTLPEDLKKIERFVDIIAMDIKLPSATKTRAFWNEHKEFLKVSSKKEVFVKIVVTAESLKSDFIKALKIVKAVNKNIVLVIQPEGNLVNNRYLVGIDKKRLCEFQRIAQKSISDVRVIPQMHKILGVR